MPRLPSAVALGMVTVSILGIVVGYRSQVAQDRSDTADRLAVQDLAMVEQANLGYEAQGREDVRVFGDLQEADANARILHEQAGRLAGGNPGLAHALTDEEAAQRDEAAALQGYFQLSRPVATRGGPEYDLPRAVAAAEATDFLSDPDALHDEALRHERTAAELSDTSTSLRLVAALFVGALAFFSLAELARSRLRTALAAGGAAVIVAASVLWGLV